jgi:hypothetical protein
MTTTSSTGVYPTVSSDASENVNPPVYAASLYNYYKCSTQPDPLAQSPNEVILTPASGVPITLQNFCGLFYPYAVKGQAFSLNPNNYNCQLYNINTYNIALETGVGTFNLAAYMIQAFCNACNPPINPNDLSSETIIRVNKEMAQYQTLSNIKGTTYALTYNELQTNISNTTLAQAPTIIYVTLNIHSFVLDTDLTVQLTYAISGAA